MSKLTKEYFDGAYTCNTKSFGQFFAPMYGVTPIEISEDQIEELKRGKVLYTDDGEYAIIIRLGERKDDEQIW